MKAQNPFHHILLIDDDETTNAVNERLIRTMEFAHNVHSVTGGAQALKYLKENAEDSDDPVDLILVDLKMEGRDGFWVLEHYHKRDDVQKARLVVALTSSASFYDLQKLKQFPEVITHVYKPLTAEHLTDLAKRLAIPATKEM